MINSNTKDIEYSNAYSELLEIFKYLDKQDYNKIPKNILDMIHANSNKNYIFKYDTSKDLNNQSISSKTKEILAAFFCEYWATPEQKAQIDSYDKNYYKNKEMLAHEKYNPDSIFKNTIQTEINDYTQINEVSLIKIDKKENIFIRIINYLKLKIFK